MKQLLQELRYAVRTLIARPGFTFVAVLSLGVGIGASTAMFSVLNAVLLRPLPYTNAERLAVIWGDMRNRHVVDFPFSPPDFDDLRKETTAFEDLAGVNTGKAPLAVEGAEPEVIPLGAVTPNFFRLMGARIALGRDFQEKDAIPQPVAQPANLGAPAVNNTPGLPAIAILSHQLWQRRYGGDPGVIGRNIDFNGGRAEIVGVLAPGFELLFAPDKQAERLPDIWVALRIDYANSSRNNVFLSVIGRLKQNESFELAQQQAETVSAELRRRFPIKATSDLHFRVEPMFEDLVRDARPVIIALMGAVTFLFLIACANVANLLLVRASARERELAVRAALGGSRWRLIRQMLAESLVLAAGGALLGAAVARIGIKLLLASGPEDLPRIESISMNLPVFVFTMVSAFVAAMVFGILPAMRASRPDLIDTLRSSGRTSGLAAASLLRKGVVAVEVALSFVLLTGSGLMLRSLAALERTNPGFDPHNLLTFVVAGVRGPGAQRATALRQLQERFRALPGVQSVTAASSLPLDGNTGPIRWGTEEAVANPGKFQAANLHIVLPHYFETLRTRLIAGRTFTEADNMPDPRYLIIDDLLAAKAFPRQSAIGKRLLARMRTPEAEWFQIIGVVAHQRDTSLAREGREEIFVTDGYMQHGAVNRWAIRASGNPLHLAAAVRSQVAQLNPRWVVTEIQPMQAFMDHAQAQTRFALLLIGIFAVIAALLAAIGLYGVLAAAVQQRTAEIGVRMALGAHPAGIFRLMIGQGLKLSAVGLIAGFAASLALTRVMVSMLVGVKPTDPVTFAVVALAFSLIAVLASWIPAWRAAALDPAIALREE
jgi:predicted permease